MNDIEKRAEFIEKFFKRWKEKNPKFNPFLLLPQALPMSRGSTYDDPLNTQTKMIVIDSIKGLKTSDD